MTLYATFVAHVRPVFERLVERGADRRLGPDRHRPPRHDHQASRRASRAGGGAMHRQPARFAGRAQIFRRAGETASVMAAARANGVGVMGIRAVQAGALTERHRSAIAVRSSRNARLCPRRGFRRLAAELGITPAFLAHRYALSLAVDTLVLGVKNRPNSPNASPPPKPAHCPPTSSPASIKRWTATPKPDTFTIGTGRLKEELP